MQRECERPGRVFPRKQLYLRAGLYQIAGYQFGKRLAPPENILHLPHLAQHIHQYALQQRVNVQ